MYFLFLKGYYVAADKKSQEEKDEYNAYCRVNRAKNTARKKAVAQAGAEPAGEGNFFNHPSDLHS